MLQKYEELKASHPITKRKSEDRGNVIHHKKIKQTTLSNAIRMAVNLDNLIVNFIIEIMSPLFIVECRSFEKLMEGANKLSKTSKFLSRRSLIHRIEEDYHKTKIKIKQSL